MKTKYSITIGDHGIKVGLVDGNDYTDGMSVHLGFVNDDYCITDLSGEYSKNITDGMLELYLMKIAEEYPFDQDLTAKFTEVWYEIDSGALVETKRKETIYSDKWVRDALGCRHYPEEKEREEKTKPIDIDLPF